ncbi:gliding motility ABC transporter, partial [Leptospira interrogans]|nr:gliding motility ABC transporter [Leptospira interrogans]
MRLLEFSKTFFLNIQTVFWKEFSIYFNSSVGSIFASFFLFLTSFLF